MGLDLVRCCFTVKEKEQLLKWYVGMVTVKKKKNWLQLGSKPMTSGFTSSALTTEP